MAFSRSTVVVHICSILLGVNSLISTSGLWVELPLMLPRLPEGWSLPSYLTLTIQAANIGPILYGLFQWLFPRHVTERRMCYVMLAIGTTAAILLAFFWDRTTVFWGSERSLALIVLTFCLAMVDSLSSMVCFPFMAVLHSKYMTSYMIGEGFSGLLPSIFSAIQGVREFPACVEVAANHSNWTMEGAIELWNATETPGFQLQKPNMPVESFFYFLFALMVCSWAGFYALNNAKLCRMQHVKAPLVWKVEAIAPLSSPEELSPMNNANKQHLGALQIDNPALDLNASCGHDADERDSRRELQLVVSSINNNNNDDGCRSGYSKNVYRCLIVVQTYMAAVFYGFLPGIQSFSCLSYGLFWYHLSAIMFSVASPVMAILYLWLPPPKPWAVFFLTALSAIFVAYITVTASLSPSPPLEESIIGKMLLFGSWTLVAALLGYIKVAVANILHEISHQALFWGGVAIQVGATIAAMLMFLLIVVYQVFDEEQICE